MKKLFLGCLFLLFISSAVMAQMVNNFDVASADTNYWMYFDNQGGQHYQTNGNADSSKGWIVINHITDPLFEGAGAMQIDYSVHNAENYGGYTKLEHWNPDSNGVYDWSGYDSLAVWYYNTTPQTLPGRVVFRLCLMDVSDSPEGNKTYSVNDAEYYYSFFYVLDAAAGWNKIQLPLTASSAAWNGEAFNQTGWAGIWGNSMIDANKIKGFSFEFSISGAGDGDFSAGTIIFDKMTLVGRKQRDFVFFNGKDFPNFFDVWAWGASSIEVEKDAGPVPGLNAIRWVQGDEWSSGWTGMGFTINPPYDMSFEWPTDTVKFQMRTDEGVGPLRLQFEDGVGKIGAIFQPTADNQWHDYAFKLSEFTQMDNTTSFNPANVVVVGMMAEASGITGKVIHITNWWTGDPEIDVIAPGAPTSVTGIAGQYYNLVIWEDVVGERGEEYNVYASENPILDLTDAGVEVVAKGVIEDLKSAAHFFYYPLKDKTVRYYYAVECKDAAGNVGPLGTSGAVSNQAKGIPTIALNPPADFAADGDLSEWDATGITPFVLKASESHWSLGTFTDDTDLNATCYIAVDADNLYFAIDVIDDIYSYDPEGNFWEDDAIEFYIGLYDTQKKHVGFKRGAEPDYKFMLTPTALITDPDYRTFYVNEDENYEFMNFGASDWAVEFVVPLDSLLYGAATNDTRFLPQNGMKITMDINIHDSDSKNVREGMLSFSEIANDNSWEGPQNWGFTWVGDTNKVATTKGLVGSWKFDDTNDLLKAEVGRALELVGSQESIAGPETGNGAVKIGVGSHYKMVHGIAANGGGTHVNEYSLMIDFKVPVLDAWHAFFQTSPDNANDGDCFIKPAGTIGVAATGYSSLAISGNEWYRLVISVKNGTQYQYYLDGRLLHTGTVQAVDGRFSLDNVLLMFADEDGEDNEIHCSELAIWNYPLSATEVAALGGYHQDGVDNDLVGVVREYELSQNYPNPFNPTTTINFAVPRAGQVKLQVFNQLGQEVATLVDEHKAMGRYKIDFNAQNLPSGIYFYRIQAGDFTRTMKAILMK